MDFAVPPGVELSSVHGQGTPGISLDRGTPQTLYAATSDGAWTYTFGEDPVSATDTLPKTGSPDSAILPILAVLVAAFSLAWLRLRGWPLC
jgi:hypothetical protein